MQLLELHILQSFPVTCLNRDDLGSPKSAYFGGSRRARVSSQCLKRAHRELFSEMQPDLSKGTRTKFIVEMLTQALEENGLTQEEIDDNIEAVAGIFSKLDKKTGKSSVLLYLSPAEINAVAKVAADAIREGQKVADIKKAAGDALSKVGFHDGIDIALFGRMVAESPSLTTEGAAMFSHALSTHKADPEMDFYTAVDDKLSTDEIGAGMMGVLEFNSACYYRYIGINLDLLKENLTPAGASEPSLSDEELTAALKSFIQAALISVPSARKNSMNGATLPSYVLGLYRSQGHPLQLVNAFESPVSAHHTGFVKPAADALKEEWKTMQETWGITADAVAELPGSSLESFTDTLIQAWKN